MTAKPRATDAEPGCGRCEHAKSQHNEPGGACGWWADRTYKFLDCDCPGWVTPRPKTESAREKPRAPEKPRTEVVVPVEENPRVCSVCKQPRHLVEFLTRGTALRKSCQRCRSRRRLIRRGFVDDKTGKLTDAGRSFLAAAQRKGLV